MAEVGRLVVRVMVTSGVLVLLGACFLLSIVSTGLLLYLIWR